MSELDEAGTARTDPARVELALDGLWRFAQDKGELVPLSVPAIGSGRGRLKTKREKLIERTAQSFVDASGDRMFAPRLTVYIAQTDASDFGVNLWEVRDLLSRSIQT
jgi:hypothetical protein